MTNQHFSRRLALMVCSFIFGCSFLLKELPPCKTIIHCRAGLSEDAENEQNIEQLDEDIAVTQTELNFICPVTQLEMKKPMKNKVCGHTYEEEAIIRMIQNRHQKNKKARCPKVGCDHSDVQVTDLVLDTTLKRAIESQNKQKGRQNSL